MRKTLLSLCALMALSLHAEVLFTENFDMTAGSTLVGQNGWYLQYSSNPSYVTVAYDGLSMANYAGSNQGYSIWLDSEEGSNMPHHSFTQVTSGSVYVAFLFQPAAVYDDGWFFSMRDNQVTSTAFNMNARVLVDEEGKVGLSVEKQSSTTKAYMDTALNSQKVYLIVVEMKMVAGAKNDSCALYVLDKMVKEKPSQPTIGMLADANVNDIQPANILFRAFSRDNLLIVDGIRVATTWEEAAQWVDDTALSSPFAGATHARKIIRNGRIYIQRGNEVMDVLGTQKTELL